MTNLEEINKDLKYLLKSHYELIKTLKKSNEGLQEMNLLMIILIDMLKKKEIT